MTRSSPRAIRPPRSTSISSSTPSAARSARRSGTSSRAPPPCTPAKGPQANQTYKYLSPSLVATDRLISELNRDEGTLTDFIVNGANVVSAVAERRADLSSLTQNANVALGSIASENRSFDQALVALPGTLRQANTTFHNLRPALDDLTPLINATRTSTKNLAPFLRQLHPLLTRSVPVFRDLNRALNLNGKSNDLADATGYLVALQKRAADAVPITVKAMQDSEPILGFFRPYTPDLTAGIAHLNQTAGYYDANGHYVRVQPAGMGVFQPTTPLTAANSATPFADFGAFGGPNYNLFRRCPGASSPDPARQQPVCHALAGRRLPRSAQRCAGQHLVL